MGNTTNKKRSAARKLIPAVGMLMTSAAMLTTSTFAWFTMSKEVSIEGITLTATVPETIEISLGSKSNGPSKDDESHIITINEPSADADWSNSVDIDEYYRKGDTLLLSEKLLPVSSVNGLNMFYTDDAVGLGLELKSDAVVTLLDTEIADGSGNSKDRYYLDIPVWFRTSTKVKNGSADFIGLSVSAEIKASEGSTALYKAARIAVLNSDKSSSESYVIKPDDAAYNQSNKAIANSNAETLDGKYSEVTFMEENATVVEVPKNAIDNSGNYGNKVKAVVRIWLEGEDKSCYNPNAGQKFSVNLKFINTSAET